ncbi:pericentriolar material 1 protein [Gastrophryne carolinensis]
MATGGGPPDEDILHPDLPNWSQESLEDRLNNMDWSGQKKANRSSEKNKKKFGMECEARLTNDISPGSSPGVGRRRTRTPHTYPHTRYMSQMSVPEQAELERLKQKINFGDLDQRSIGSDSQGRATAANNKRQVAENRKPFNFLQLQLNTNKEKPVTPSPSKREISASSLPKDLLTSTFSKDAAPNFQASLSEDERDEQDVDSQVLDPQQEAKEELKNMKKQHALLTRILQQQEQLRALKGRQAALLTLQHKAAQAIAVMDDSVVTETTGSVSGLSLTSELNDELNDLIQRFHNQLHDVQTPPVPDNRRQAESLSLTREVSRSLNSSISEPPSEDRSPLFSKVGVLLEKKQKMDSILGELHTLQDQHLNNTACSPQRSMDQRSMDQRSIHSVGSAPQACDNRSANSPAVAESNSVHDSDDEENQNPAEKLKKLKEVRKRLNELRDLVRYYEQASDMMADAVNENTKDDEEEETEDSWIESDQEANQPVTNIRNPQRLSSWGPVNSLSNSQCGANNRDERPLNTDCGINNRAAVNLRTFNVSTGLDCLYNRGAGAKEQHCNIGPDVGDEDEDQESAVSFSSRSSVAEDAQNAEYEEKFNRLVAAKQKLKQLQELISIYDGDTESESLAADRPASRGRLLLEGAPAKQQPNNTRVNASIAQKEVALKEQAREKFYETKLQQQQNELKQLQEERKKLIEIQEKIQTLRKACPDLQLSPSSFKSGPTIRNTQTASSTPDIIESNAAAIPNMPDPEDSSSVDNEVWSEIRKHQILREDLRQRRKQLESLMAEHQRRQGLPETASACSLRSEDSETHGLHQQSKTEKTMATWGGSTQCALEEEDDDDASISEVNQAEDEEEEDEQDYTLHENASYTQNSRNQSMFRGKDRKQGWKGQRPHSVDGNYRQSPRTRQQQNISMQRQENLRWVSELSQVEEKQHWQEQIDQLKKQLEFSTNICQTLMRDQQSLSYLLQSMFASPYNVMPGNLGTPQVHFIMHQLNQCCVQLNWQQNNVLRLKQMLNDVMQQEQMSQNSEQQKPGESSVPPPSSPNVFNQYTFLPPTTNLFNATPFGNIPHMVPGMNFNPVFQPGIGDFTEASTPRVDVHLQPHDPNTSGKTEYMAFPKPFESTSSNVTDRQRTSPRVDGEQNRSVKLENQMKDDGKKACNVEAGYSASTCSLKPQEAERVKQFDEESMDSLSSMPDPGDPTTVTKAFRSRKASAQASLASRDKTPKSKTRKRKTSHQKHKGLKNIGLRSASSSSIPAEPKESRSRHAQTEETGPGTPITSDHLQRLQKDTKAGDVSSEAGSDFSMFEALRDTIYTEVAALISQNESRPHFLIELFHELQLLSTDFLRQKALFALQDIVTRRLTENADKKHEGSKPLESAAWMASNSELTPSESLATTDDEMYAKNTNSQTCNNGEQIDADNISTLSTSSNFEPFATDDLGNTVIHLDQALARMREYERMKIEAESNLAAECCSKLKIAPANAEASNDEDGEEGKPSNDGSAVPCPRIDTQQLDRQIKAIMKEVIPFLKEHMEEVCSSHLLTSIRRMVLTLTQQNDESKEFVKLFHKQLGSILQDSLAKFTNKKLKDCGEDLLVEISEVLFNELAFFRLMQDLDNNSSSVQSKGQQKSDIDILQSFTKEARKMLDGSESSDAREVDDEDKDKDETEAASKLQNKHINVSVAHSGRSDISEEEDGNEHMPVSISLSKAETQALTNYGSGEDENEDEEENYEFEAGPVDVQTSLEANNEPNEEHEKQQISKNPVNELDDEDTPPQNKEDLGLIEKTEEEQSPPIPNDKISPPLCLNKEDNVCTSVDVDAKSSSLASTESSDPGSPATDSPVLVNEYQETGSGNLSQKSDEDDFVKVEDLPLKLDLSKAELIAEMEKEELNNSLCDEILNGQRDGADMLAGDALSLKEPESSGAHSG